MPVEPPEIPAEPVASSPDPGNPWREELAERLQDHRRRRSRTQGAFEPSSTLDLAFDGPARQEPAELVDAQLIDSENGSDASFAPPLGGTGEEMPILDSVPLEKPLEDAPVLPSRAAESGEMHPGAGESGSEPVEIVLESSQPAFSRSSGRQVPGNLKVAPLGVRFAAGVVDAVVLLSGAGLFALIFWVVGGHISRNALNLAVLGSISTLFILAYFGIFVALSSSTPGLLCMDLEVRSLDGGAPSPQEASWRAFGYLVSMASLMLGFIWASLDGDRLTWHDHMSGTYITGIDSRRSAVSS